MANLVPYKKSNNSIVKTNKFLPRTKISSVDSKKEKTSLLDSPLLKIERKVIKIDKLLKDSLLLSKKENEKGRVQKEEKKFEEREKELEKKKPKPVAGIKLPSLPGVGILGWIKNFIVQTVLGFLAVRLIDYLPKLLSVLPAIIKVTDFITDIGGKMLDGLITFVDKAYDLVDNTRKFAKTIGGDGLAQTFDKFTGALGTMLDIAVIAAISAASQGGDGGGGGPGGGRPRKGFDSTGRRVNVNAQKRYAQRFGRDQFLKRFGKRNLVNLGEKGAAKGILSAVRPLLKRIPIPVVGALIDFGLSWALGEDPGRAAFRAIGAGLLGWVGTALGGGIGLAGGPLAFVGAALGGVAGGTLGDMVGGALYDLFFGGKKKQGKVAKAAGGGKPSTRGGKLVSGPAKRTLKKKKTPRTLRATPSKLKPGGSVGGEKKIKELYPESKDKTKMNPFEFLKKSYETFSKSTGLGALVALAIKPLMGDKPSYADYKSVGVGINNWMNSSVGSGTLAYAGGGEVKMESIISGEDYSDVIAKSVQDSVAPQVDRTIQDLMKQLMLKKSEPEIKEKEPTGEPTTPEGIPLDGGSTASGKSLMQGLVQRGFTKEEASAIVGNLWAESGFRTNATNPSSGAFGLMQWLGGRKSRLYSYAAEKGKSVTDANLQLDYIKWELKGGNAYETAQFQKAMAYGSSVADKTKGFAYEVERASPGELSSSMPKRIGAAESVYGGKMVVGETPSPSNASLKGGSGKFVQGNSGNSGGIHFHIGPGSQPGQVDTKYNADARAAASKVVKHFLGKKSLYDGRRGASYTSGDNNEIMAAQRAHSASGSQGGIDIQVGGAYDPGAKVPFPFAVSNMAYRPGGFGVSAKIQGLNAFVAHGRYDENGKIAKQERGVNLYAFHGKVGISPKDGFMIKLHKGEMFKVVDKDSVDLFGRDFIQDIIDIENKPQLIARAPSIIQKLKALSGYMDYEQPYGEPEIVYVEVPVLMPMGGGGSSMIVGGGGDNYVNSNMEQTLAQIG
jgi:hypothetical protein